nr:hypothetical protein [Oxalobacteraceae bacterium]
RAAESQKLLNYGFQNYDSVKLYEAGQAVAGVAVWKGAANSVKAGFPNPMYVSVPKGQADKLKARLESQQPLVAPVAAGQKLGVMQLTLDGKPYADIPVVALEAVPLAGIFGRGWDSMRLSCMRRTVTCCMNFSRRSRTSATMSTAARSITVCDYCSRYSMRCEPSLGLISHSACGLPAAIGWMVAGASVTASLCARN